MKKALICLILVYFVSITSAFALDYRAYAKYLDADYVGMPFGEAISRETPFLLIIATPKNPFAIIQAVPLGSAVYKNFKSDYNFCILNFDKPVNQNVIDRLNVCEKELPATYIVDVKINSIFKVKTQNLKNETKIINELKQYLEYRQNFLNN